MPKQLNVDLTFRANTDQAKRQIADLQKSLQAVGTSSKGIDIGVNAEEIKKASAAAAELQRHLTAATDVNTGKLNLSTFSASLKASGKTLQQYKAELEAIGPQGQKAFDNLSRSIANAEAPIKRTNKLLAEMGTVLKNTIRWQISSTMIHGFMGAVQQAYGYVQDLNESLTNIRIVTGQSTEQMAAFADRANKAAQALSTTTTAYTDAALIFYQQGLSDKEVEERTNATIKMAQVTGDSAQEVSSYMTAIWNNFDDGSESLEHYADVITALGAATASSSAEISEGLEKFASIADTVGLSYEYATTALATVVAQTRQSADVVGTAFKTMFARIQDLELGKTLEDGVDLGQYSKALAKVGVDVMDANGQLRAMDDILDDIGQRWGELGEAERVALAQNVAGQRQYAQFMAIFENWGTFQENLKVANTSDGTLQKQADIYADSWEAAEKRVRAAMEDIYDDILDDKFFIQLTNGFAEVLKSVKGLMEGMGGLKGMIPIFAGFITQKLAKEAPMALNKIKENLLIISGQAGKTANIMQQENLKNINSELHTYSDVGQVNQSAARYGELQGMQALAEARMTLNKNAHLYSEQELQLEEQKIAKIEQTIEVLKAEGQQYDDLKEKRESQEREFTINAHNTVRSPLVKEDMKQARSQALEVESVKQLDNAYRNLSTQLDDQSISLDEYKKSMLQVINNLRKFADGDNELADTLDVVEKQVLATKQGINGFDEDLKKTRELLDDSAGKAQDGLVATLSNLQEHAQTTDTTVNNYGDTLLKTAQKQITFNSSVNNIKAGMPELSDKVTKTSEAITSLGGAMMTMRGSITAIGSGLKTLFDEDASAAERLGAAIGIISSSIMTLNALTKTTQALQTSEIGKKTLNVAVTKILAKVKGEEAGAGAQEAAAATADTAAQAGDAAAKGTNTGATLSLAGAMGVLETTIAPVLVLTLAIGAALAAIAAVAYVVSEGIEKISDAYNADAIAAENTAAAAAELKNQYEETKTAYEDLKTSIEDYQGAKEAMDEMVTGTLEWKEALIDANSQALDLINKLNLVQGQDWSYGSNGEILINDSALERGQNEELNRVTQASVAANLASYTSEMARIQADKTDVIHKELEHYVSIFSTVSHLYDEQTHSWINLRDEINGVRDELAELDEASNRASDNLQIMAEASAGVIFGNDENYNNTDSNVQNLVRGVGGAVLADAYEQAYQNYLNQANSRGVDEGGIGAQFWQDFTIAGLITDNFSNTTSRRVAEQYFDLLGLSDKNGFSIDDYTDDGKVHYSYIDEDGTRKEAEATSEMIAATLAAAEAQGVLEGQTQDLINEFNSLMNSTDLANHAIGNFLSAQNVEGATYSEVSSLQQQVAEHGGSYNRYLEDLASELNFASVDEMAQLNGYESGQAMADALQQGMVDGLAGWDDIRSNGYFDQLSENIQNQMSMSSANALVNAIDNMDLGPMGQEAGTLFVNGLNTMMQDVDEEDLTSALNEIMSIDWTSYDAFDEAVDIMHEYGVEIDSTSAYWVQFVENMRRATGAIPDYSQLQQQLQDIVVITEKLDFGKVVTDEDYEKLVAYNDQWERFFILQANGSRVFIGDSQQILNSERARIAGLQEEVNMRQQLAEQFDNSWGWTDSNGEVTYADWGQLNSSNLDWEGTVANLSSHLGSDDITDQVLTELGYTSERLSEMTAEEFDVLAQNLNDFIHEDFAQASQELQEMYASTATNFYELSSMFSDGIINNDAYQKQSEYLLNTITSVEQLQDAYELGYVALEQYQNALDGVIERQAEQLGLEGNSVLVQSQEMAEAYNLEAGAAARLAIQNQLMNRGVSALSQNWEDWREELEKTDTTTQDYADTVVDVTKAIKDLVGIADEDFRLSSEFLKAEENLELLEEAAQGSEEAIDRLGVAVAQDLVSNLQSIEDSFDFSGLGISDSGFMHNIFDNFESDKNIVMSGLEELQNQINNLAIGDDVTQILGDDWINALNRMAIATSMTVDQMNDMLNSMGVEANVTTTTVKTHVSVPWYRTREEVTGDGTPDDPYIRESHTVATGYDSVPGEIEVAQLNTGKNAGTPPSITRIGNGGVSSSATSGHSGGGGGGGKSGSKKDKKDPTGEIERYHVINNQIEDNEKALTRLSKAKDRAYGKARLNAMDAEIAKQRESVELAERKLQEVEKYLELDSGAIAAFGAEFDANGTIVNYDQLMQQQIDKYNAAVEAYNNSSMDENAEAVFQQAEDDYNAFTEALKQYEETQDLWYEQAQAVADAKAEVLQLELEKTNYKVEIGIEWEEEDIARLDFMLKRIEDDAHKAAEAIGLLGERTVDAMDKYNVYQQGFADTLRNLGVGNAEDVIARASAGEDLYGMIGGIVDPNQMAQAVDQMDDYISNMMSSLEDAQDSVDQAFEKVKNVFSDNVKKMDEYIDKIEFCQKITKSYMNIVDIVGKKSLGITNEMLRTFNAESVTQAINNEAAAKAKMDTIQAQLMESQARLAQASSEAEQKYWNEIIEEQEKELISATENFHQAWEDALQANLEAFENNIELVIEDFSNAVGDLNAMKAEWDLQKSLTDMWEPEYERWHQLSDLINDINKSVDENENLKYKQDLLDLEQEIAALQEEEAQLSEYDLNYLRLRYEAKLAEIALEEAQNAKSQVRMSRDNEGNYSYVYTADEDAVNNAADDYRNKIYEMEKANEEYIDTLQEQLLDMHDKMLEDIKEAGDLYGIGTEAYFEAIDRIEQTYLGQSQFIQAQMQNVFDNNQRLRDEDIIQYVAYTGDIAAQNVDLQLSFADTYMGIQTQSDNLNTYFNDTWIPALETTFDNAREVTDHYVETNEIAMETAGTTMDEFSARATQDMAMATAQTEELARQTKNYEDTAVRAFARAAQAWQTGPGSMLNAIESQAAAIANLAQQYTSLKSQLDAATASAIALAHAMNQPVSSSPSSVGGAATSGGGSGGGSSSSNNSGGGNGSTYTNYDRANYEAAQYAATQAAEAQRLANAQAEAIRRRAATSYNPTDYYKSKASRYASGGYTGEWSDEPRWALLDQKELVLNAKDTMNLLSAVDVVRQLANSIDLNTMSANIAGASIKSASGTPGTIEQKVEITASFPNATDRNEIEQAFQNLVNHASQYANRKD